MSASVDCLRCQAARGYQSPSSRTAQARACCQGPSCLAPYVRSLRFPGWTYPGRERAPSRRLWASRWPDGERWRVVKTKLLAYLVGAASSRRRAADVPVVGVGAGHVVAGDVGNVHGDRPGGERGSIGRLGHAGVTLRMSHDRAPTRRLSCRALPPAVALVVTSAAHMTAAICERHSWVRLAVGVLPRRWNRRFPKQLGEWLAKQA